MDDMTEWPVNATKGCYHGIQWIKLSKKTIQPTSNLWHWHALAWSIAWDLSLYSHAALIVLPAALCSPKDQNMLMKPVLYVWIMPCADNYTLDWGLG
jgi:hypothetical protein